jgi:hypothetical protein
MSERVVPWSTIPGTSEYVETALSVNKQQLRLILHHLESFAARCRELQACEAWRVYFTDEPKSWERLCREVFQQEPAVIDKILALGEP